MPFIFKLNSRAFILYLELLFFYLKRFDLFNVFICELSQRCVKSFNRQFKLPYLLEWWSKQWSILNGKRLKVKTTTVSTPRIEWTHIHIHSTYHFYTCHKARADALNAAISSRYRARTLKWKRAQLVRRSVLPARPYHWTDFIVARVSAPSKCRVAFG